MTRWTDFPQLPAGGPEVFGPWSPWPRQETSHAKRGKLKLVFAGLR